MAKPEWGRKHTCQSCGAPFYDLKRVPATCPKCGSEVAAQANRTRRPTLATTAEESPPKPAADGDAVAAEDDDDDLIEDASDLGEDASDLGEDDMSEVKEHIETDLDGKD